MNTSLNKTAVITGANSHIGLATAKRFAEEGAFVLIAGRRQAELDRTAALIGRNVTAVKVDVTKLDELDRQYSIVRDELGHIDMLFANSGSIQQNTRPNRLRTL